MSGAEHVLPHSRAAAVCFVWTRRDGLRSFVKLESGTAFSGIFFLLLFSKFSRVRVTREQQVSIREPPVTSL